MQLKEKKNKSVQWHIPQLFDSDTVGLVRDCLEYQWGKTNVKFHTLIQGVGVNSCKIMVDLDDEWYITEYGKEIADAACSIQLTLRYLRSLQ